MAANALAFDEERLFRLPPGCTADGVTALEQVYALEVFPDGRVRLIWHGIAGEPFDQVARTRDGIHAYWSVDGSHLAFTGIRNGGYFVWRDGREEGPYEGVSQSVRPTFDSLGRTLVYGASIGGRMRLIRDAQVVADADLAPVQAVFSPDGSRLAWVEMREQPERAQRIVINEQPGPWFAGMRNARGAMQFSPDGRRFAYYRIDGKGHGQWIVDDVEQQVMNDVRPVGFAQLRGIGVLDPPLPAAFSPDGRRFAYEGDVLEKGVAIVEDDHRGPLLRRAGPPVFSADSAHLAYVGESFEKRFGLVVDGVLGATTPATNVGSPVFSPDGRRAAVTIERTEGGLFRKRHVFGVLCDDRMLGERPGTDVSLEPRFSPDGTRLAWWVEDDETCAVLVNGVEQPSAGSILGNIHFSPSGRLMHAARYGSQATIVIDGRPGTLVDGLVAPSSLAYQTEAATPFELAPDGEHVGWAGVVDDAQRPILDDQVGPRFDRVIDWRWEGGAVVWWAQRGDEVVRVTASP